jgi:hypothetical protein
MNFPNLFDGRQYTKVTHTEKYAGDLMLLAKEETALQGVINCVTEIGRYTE